MGETTTTLAEKLDEIPHRMRYLVRWGDDEFDSDTLSVIELEVLEAMLGKGFGDCQPLVYAADYVALVTVFRMRNEDVGPEALVRDVAGVTVGEIWNSVTPYAIPTVRVGEPADHDREPVAAEE